MTSTSVLKRRLLDACDQTCSLIFDEASLVSLHLMTWTSSLLKQQNTGRTRPPEPHGPERTEGAAEGLDQPRSENGWTLSSYDMPSQPARRQKHVQSEVYLEQQRPLGRVKFGNLGFGLDEEISRFLDFLYIKKSHLLTRKNKHWGSYWSDIKPGRFLCRNVCRTAQSRDWETIYFDPYRRNPTAKGGNFRR